MRLLAAAALLGLAALVGRHSWAALRGRWHHLAVAGALVNGVTLSAFHVGMVIENVAVMALLQSLGSTLIALSAGPLLGERLRSSQWLGLGVAGLAGGTIYFRRFCEGVPLLAATTVQVAAGALLTVALALGLERMHAVWTAPAVTSVVWNVLAVSIGAMALYYYLLARGTAGRVAANFYLVPGTVAVAAWALLGERLTPLAVLGFAIASTGVFLVARASGP